MTTVAWTQFDANVCCANCRDSFGATTTLLKMRYDSMLPTMTPRLKLHRVKRRGATRARRPSLTDSSFPDAVREVRAKFDPVDLPTSPNATLDIECPRCGSARMFRLRTSFEHATDRAKESGPGTMVPGLSVPAVPKVTVWV